MRWPWGPKEEWWEPEAEVEDAQQDGSGVREGGGSLTGWWNWKLSGVAVSPHVINIINIP